MKIALMLSFLGLILLGMQIQANSNTSTVVLDAKMEYFTTSIFEEKIEVVKNMTMSQSQYGYIVSPFELAK